MINWEKVKDKDMELLLKIAKRYQHINPKVNMMDLQMDITACHLATPLKLKELLEADDFNFVHDVVGISNNIDRITGTMLNCFLPRFSK
jgi:hypothetical protein